ncbi:MAG: DUF1963 domain-containing protein [Polyangiaceae bacterium]|nr:DUF1963 domain-containing protein [Polyangiaceae bacterium]
MKKGKSPSPRKAAVKGTGTSRKPKAKKAAVAKVAARAAPKRKTAAKKAAPKKAAPKKAAAKKAGAKKAAPKSAAAKKAAPKKAAPKKAAPKKAVAKKAAPRVIPFVLDRPSSPPPPGVYESNGVHELSAMAQLLARAESGDAQAACAVGDAYYRGDGIEEDFVEARDWYERAAVLGSVTAAENLIFFYSKGDAARWSAREPATVPMRPDLERALHWARATHAAGKDQTSTIAYLEKQIAGRTVSEAPPPPSGDPEVQRRQFVELARAAGLEGPIEQMLAESVRLVVSDDPSPDALGTSRLGGLPDVPEDFEWPEGPTMPLSFVGQISLTDVAPLASQSGLPTSGLLLFFWDAAECAWGQDPSESDRFRVVFVRQGERLRRATRPERLVAPHRYARVEFEPVAVRPQREVTLPFPRTAAARSLVTSDAEMQRYFDVYAKASKVWPAGREPYHRMFGHPDAIQGDMTRRIAYALAGRSEEIDEAPLPAVEDDARAFRLLLQVDDNSSMDTQWGSGRLFFWIREDDLAACRFDRAWFQFQS